MELVQALTGLEDYGDWKFPELSVAHPCVFYKWISVSSVVFPSLLLFWPQRFRFDLNQVLSGLTTPLQIVDLVTRGESCLAARRQADGTEGTNWKEERGGFAEKDRLTGDAGETENKIGLDTRKFQKPPVLSRCLVVSSVLHICREMDR